MSAPYTGIPSVLWTSGGTNVKTGNVPAAWVGATREESKASCEGCPLLASKQCYAQYGTTAMGHSSMVRAAARGKVRTMAEAIAGRVASARMVRIGAIGEPGRLPLSWYQEVRAAAKAVGLDVVGYTHRWRARPDLAGETMASCDSLAEVDEAAAAGFRATVVLPADHDPKVDAVTLGGVKVKVCPAIRTEGRVTCNDCRLCDGSKRGPMIGFPDHGPKARRARA